MISATILTKNSEKHLREVLTALKVFDEVVILDNGSTDTTLAIAREFPNTTIYEETFVGFGPTHNLASSKAKHDWILSIDSDEIVTDELAKEILNTKLDPQCVYGFQRDNYYRGKQIKWCGWYPERIIRLYNRNTTKFSDHQVHEKIITDHIREISLKHSIKHFPYNNVSDFLRKMQHYSDLFAKQNINKKKSSPWIALEHGFFALFKSYILKRGFLGGYEGFLISVYNGHTAFYKYIKLYEMNSNGCISKSSDQK